MGWCTIWKRKWFHLVKYFPSLSQYYEQTEMPSRNKTDLLYVVLWSILLYTPPLTGNLAFKSWVRSGVASSRSKVTKHRHQIHFQLFPFSPSQTCLWSSSAHCQEVYCSLQHPILLNLFHINSLFTDLKLKYPWNISFFPRTQPSLYWATTGNLVMLIIWPLSLS